MSRSVLGALLLTAVLPLVACDTTTPTVPAAISALSTSFTTPVPGAIRTQGFGCTDFGLEPVNPACPGGHFHAGLDLAAPQGTPVRAAAGGLVQAVRWDPAGYGLYLVIDHGHGLTTLYGHLWQAASVLGQPVLRGEQVGQVGSSGNSTGAHLHFEVRTGGRPADPELFLPAANLRGGSS
jgi:murein DD-endopeptidase MepM/ murein hydrolase activator NlpD